MTEIDWAGLLAEEDVEGIWNGLFQMVSRHPAVRPLHFATDGAAVTSQIEINADLTQELFLELFQKGAQPRGSAPAQTVSRIFPHGPARQFAPEIKLSLPAFRR